ncbi:unnamed protein product [Blepharisma stoltei]|uniref:Maturase K n=1 Tax=Blepharisma stoltei TaxID=1481888 RepID=A0AAU9JQ56_9CILI|nr:unnamed protein product [Blepharisma stoltei]
MLANGNYYVSFFLNSLIASNLESTKIWDTHQLGLLAFKKSWLKSMLAHRNYSFQSILFHTLSHLINSIWQMNSWESLYDAFWGTFYIKDTFRNLQRLIKAISFIIADNYLPTLNYFEPLRYCFLEHD